MDHAVLNKHVWLDDASGGAARCDKFSSRVGAEVEVLTGSGGISGVDERWAVDRCSVDHVVPQNFPEFSLVARELRKVLGRGLVGRDEEGETADPSNNICDASVLDGMIPGVPDRNLRAAGKIGEPCQVIVRGERAVDVAWIVQNSIDDVDVEVLVAGDLRNMGVGGPAVYGDDV